MRMALFSSVFAFSVGFSGTGTPADLCSTLDKHTLYLVETNNVQKVVPYYTGPFGYTNIYLNESRSYRFYYRTDDTPVEESLVAIQMKYMGLILSDDGSYVRRVAKKPVGVNLERDPTPFACGRIPADYRAYKYEDDRGVEKAVGYDTYDRFHRWGILGSDEDPVLNEKFHIFYHTGTNSPCVRSNKGHRDALFLMHARNALPAAWEQAAYRVGFFALAKNFRITSAYADTPTERKANDLSEVTPYLKLKMLLTNYQKTPMTSGCFTFSANTGLSNPREKLTELDISFSDLEESVSHYPEPNWNYQAEYKFLLR